MMLRRYKKNRLVANVASNLETKTEEVPEESTSEEPSIEDGSVVTDSDGEKEEEPIPYKRSDISRMGVADLRELATNLGIENAENTSGEKLKEAIIANLGL